MLLAAFPALAQDLTALPQEPDREPAMGHSATYYGLLAPEQRDASIRAILSGFQVDAVSRPPGVLEASAFLLVQMFSGGGGAPTDIVRPRAGVDEFAVLEGSTTE